MAESNGNGNGNNGNGAKGNGEELRTLFISGLPDDIKEREIYNLFRPYDGYEHCQLKYTGRGYQIVAFAMFSDQATAILAKDALNGIKFDPESNSTLHIELARANSRSKRSRLEDGYGSALEKKARVLTAVPGVGGTVHMPGMVHPVYSDTTGYHPPSQSAGIVGAPYATQDNMLMGHSYSSSHVAPGSNNPPCSTIFIANLGSKCTETELTQVLASFPGFVKVKMQRRGGLPTAFAEYQDEYCSSQALQQLQNHMLPSSEHVGMRLEYAKSRMGMPRRETTAQRQYYH